MKYTGGSDVHQYSVEKLLQENGFTHSVNLFYGSISKKERDAALSGGSLDSLQNGEYISQPCGSQESPDFIVKYNDKIYFIECKSSEKTGPTWNSCYPQINYIYIFTSKKYNETTIFRGEDVLFDEKRKLYTELLNKQNLILEEFRKNPIWQKDSRGFDYYTRDMYTQSGTSDKTDYFKHADRKMCEQNVLNSL